MPARIADEKKVVALMIRMYCRRHCRQQGRTAKTDQINRTGRTDLSSQIDMANQLIRTNQINQVGVASQFSQPSRTTDINQNANSPPLPRVRRAPRLCPPAARQLPLRERQAQLPQMPGPLLPRRHEGTHTHGHALGRPENDIPPPTGRDKAPAARTPLPGTSEIAFARRNLKNYANFVYGNRTGATTRQVRNRQSRSRQPNGQ